MGVYCESCIIFIVFDFLEAAAWVSSMLVKLVVCCNVDKGWLVLTFGIFSFICWVSFSFMFVFFFQLDTVVSGTRNMGLMGEQLLRESECSHFINIISNTMTNFSCFLSYQSMRKHVYCCLV